MIVDGSHRSGDRNGGEGGAGLKGIRTDGSHRCGDVDGSDGRASRVCIIWNGCELTCHGDVSIASA